MKKWAMALFVILISVQMSAQEFYFIPKVGMNFANLVPYGDNERKGMNFGISGEIRTSNVFAIEPGIYYSMQGYRSKGDQVTAKLNCDYLNIPVYAKAYMFNGFYVFGGPQLGINVRAKIKDMVVSDMPGMERRRTEDIKDEVNNIDFALCAGAGYSFDWGLMVSANYNVGLTNVYKRSGGESDSMYDNASNNGVIQVNIGWRFRLK